MIPTLSDAAARRIVQAAESALDDEAGSESDPSAAIAKAADAHSVPTGHVRLVAHAYNTARAAWQRESGSTAGEKAAEFPLADPARAVALLCPDRPGRKAATSPEYARPPSWYAAPAVDSPKDWSLALKVAGGDPDESEAARFRRDMKSARIELDRSGEDRLSLAALAGRAAAAVRGLDAAMNATGAPGFVDVKAAAAVLHGRAGEAAMDHYCRLHPELVKLASRDPYHRTSDHPGLYAALSELVASGRDLAAGEAAFEARSAGREKAAMDTLAPWAARFSPPPAMPPTGSIFDPQPGAAEDGNTVDPMLAQAGSFQPSLFDPMPGEPKLASVPQAVGIGLMVGKSRDMLDGMLGNIRGMADPGARAQKMVGKLSDPDHESALSDIGTRAAISTMLANDHVLRGYGPAEVAREFNEISDVAPALARRPIMARPLLRKYLAMGHLDSFEGSEAVKSEKGLRELQAPPAARPPEKKPAGGETR